MMRTTALAFWISLAGWITASSRPAPGQADARDERPAGWPSEVQGLGRDEQKAKAEAIQQALNHFEAILAETEPGIDHWTPDADFVERHLVEKPGFPGPDKHMEYSNGEGKSKLILRTWIYPLRPLPHEILHQLDQQARLQQRSLERQAVALRVVAGAVLACALALGVLHLKRRRA